MSAIRSRENRTEVALRRYLHSTGLRFRKYTAGLSGRPDFVFVSARVAVFVDGDFWHARLLREHGLAALTSSLQTPRREYWIAKFVRRVLRDEEVNVRLRKAGWLVMRFWESDVRKNMLAIARRIEWRVRKRQLGEERRPSRRPIRLSSLCPRASARPGSR